MPNYEFACDTCALAVERLLPISKRNSPQPCPSCTLPMTLVPSAPAVSIWDSSRSFPLSPDSDGYTFASRQEYENHLKENHIGEVSTDAPGHSKPCVWKKNYGRI
jgi:putative FmdB family regulatory protein